MMVHPRFSRLRAGLCASDCDQGHFTETPTNMSVAAVRYGLGSLPIYDWQLADRVTRVVATKVCAWLDVRTRCSQTRWRAAAEGVKLAPKPMHLLLGSDASGSLTLGFGLGSRAGSRFAFQLFASFLGRRQVRTAVGVVEPQRLAHRLQMQAQNLADQPVPALGNQLVLAINQPVAAK